MEAEYEAAPGPKPALDAGADQPVTIGVHDSRGVQVNEGAGNVQINIFGAKHGDEVPQATPGEFRSDATALLLTLDADACGGHLPAYFPTGADVTSMTRTVRVLGRVRRGDSRAPGREMVYAPPSAQDTRVDEEPKPWEWVAAAHERLMVLADPGMGKSWLVRTETHRLAQVARASLDRLAPMDDVIIPIPVRADALAASPGASLSEAICGYLVGLGALPPRSIIPMRAQIDGGGVVLLIDALDEVPRESLAPGAQEPRRRLEDLLRRWAAQCTGTVRCVLTSRLAGYIGAPVPQAHEVELLPFSDDDVKAAMRAWRLPSAAVAKVERFIEKPALAGMSRIPLLLALICSLAADTSGQRELPDTRTGLYEAVVWQFLSAAHRSGEIGSMVSATSPATRQGLLEVLTRVAYSFAGTSQGWIDRMSHHDVIAAIRDALPDTAISGAAPTAVLAQLEHQAGILVPAGNPVVGDQPYMFLHRTIAEYLVARHLSELDRDHRRIAIRHHEWFDPDWAEVIPMLGGLLASRQPLEAQEFIASFMAQRPDPLWRALRMAIRILGETNAPDRLLSAAQAEALSGRIRTLFPKEVLSDGLDTVLADLPVWPQAVTDTVIGLLDHKHSLVRQNVLILLRERREPGVTEAILRLADDRSVNVRRSVAFALIRRPGLEVTTVLMRLAAEDRDQLSPLVRMMAGLALQSRRSLEPGLTDTLIQLLADGQLTVNAAWALQSNLFPDSPMELSGGQTEALLRLFSSTSSSIRAAAATALKDNEAPEVTAALLRLSGDGAADVRAAAAESLIRRPETAVTESLLRLTGDSQPEVRRAAAESLRERSERPAIDALMRLLDDDNVLVRAAAAASLAPAREPEVTDRLLRALLDPSIGVRDAAAAALRERRDPEMLQGLLRLLSDPNHNARRSAAIALRGKIVPDVTIALTRRLTDTDNSVRAAAAASLAPVHEPQVTDMLLRLLTNGNGSVRKAAADSLEGRSDPRILTWLCQHRLWRIRAGMRKRGFTLADNLADQTYLLLPPKARTRVKRRLAGLTRSVSHSLDLDWMLEIFINWAEPKIDKLAKRMGVD